MNRTFTRGVAAVAGLLLVPALGGCYQGPNAATVNQETTGNGTQVQAGDIWVEALTVVAGGDGSVRARLIGSLVNAGGTAETLEQVSVAGTRAVLAPDPVEIPAGSTVRMGNDVIVPLFGAAVEPGTYVPVVLTFGSAGIVEADVLVVPPVSFYDGFGPIGSGSGVDLDTPGAGSEQESPGEADEQEAVEQESGDVTDEAEQ